MIAIRGRGESMILAGEGLRRIDTGAWSGQAGDAFRDKFSYEPPKWLTAGDSFDAASIALAGFGDAALGAASSRRSDSALGGGQGHHPAGTVAVQYGSRAGPRPEYGPRRRRVTIR